MASNNKSKKGNSRFKCDCHNEFLALLRRAIGCKHDKNNRARLWVFHEGADKPITPIPKVMEVTLAKPIAPGFYRECEVGTDEAVDKQADGSYALGASVLGDSTAPKIRSVDDPERPSTAKLIRFDVFGDGVLGAHQATVTVDTKFGDEVVPMVLTINYVVASKEATEFVGFVEGADKAIPV